MACNTRVLRLLCLVVPVLSFTPSSTSWTAPSSHKQRSHVGSRHVEMRGMFDGIKDAFSGDDADMAIDVDRETP